VKAELRKIKIFAPIAEEGDRVEVLNTRRKPAEWEPGEVLTAPAYYGHGRRHYGETRRRRGYWTYVVRLDRRSASRRNPEDGRPIDLHVGDDKIRRRK
jgi:hypothetical protein